MQCLIVKLFYDILPVRIYKNAFQPADSSVGIFLYLLWRLYYIPSAHFRLLCFCATVLCCPLAAPEIVCSYKICNTCAEGGGIWRSGWKSRTYSYYPSLCISISVRRKIYVGLVYCSAASETLWRIAATSKSKLQMGWQYCPLPVSEWASSARNNLGNLPRSLAS